MRPLLLIPFVLLGLSACASEPEPEPIEQPAAVPVAEEVPVYFDPVVSGPQARIADTTEVVFREPGPWQEFLGLLRPAGEPPAEVDFSQVMLAAAVVPAPTSGYEVEVDAVTRTEDETVVFYTVREPGPDCITAQVMTAPFQVVQLPAAEGPVRFERETVEYSCALRQRR